MKNPIQSLENTVFTSKLNELIAWGRKNSLDRKSTRLNSSH